MGIIIDNLDRMYQGRQQATSHSQIFEVYGARRSDEQGKRLQTDEITSDAQVVYYLLGGVLDTRHLPDFNQEGDIRHVQISREPNEWATVVKLDATRFPQGLPLYIRQK